MLPNKHFFDLFWKVASLDGDSRSMSYADLAMGEDYGLFADLDPSFPGNEAAGSIRGAFFFLLDIAQDRHCSMSEATMRQINIDREMPEAFNMKFPKRSDKDSRAGCVTTAQPFVCRDGWESDFRFMLSEPPERGTGVTEASCMLKALGAGYQGYYFDWNPHLGGWCRMVINADLQSSKMARSSNWVDWASSHTCIRKSVALPSLDTCLQSGLCKTLPNVSQITSRDQEEIACRRGWENNWRGILGDPPLVGGGITEEQCKHSALRQGYLGYYFDWGFAGGWCRFVIDADTQAQNMHQSTSWVDWPTSHTCVVVSASPNLRSCLDSGSCYPGDVRAVSSGRRLSAVNESFMV